MSARNGRIFAVIATAASILASTQVSAATIVVAFRSDGTLPPTQLLKSNTYDFTFAIAPPLSNNLITTVYISAQAPPDNPFPVQYQMYAGDPGHGTFMAQSTWDIEPLVSFNPLPGH